jgi:acetyl-CoA C-acetyltransferase
MGDVVVVSGKRTPVGTFGKTLKSTPVVDLGALVLKETLKSVQLKPVATENLNRFEPDALKGLGMIDLEKQVYDYDDGFAPVEVDEVIMGNVVGAAQGRTWPVRP